MALRTKGRRWAAAAALAVVGGAGVWWLASTRSDAEPAEPADDAPARAAERVARVRTDASGTDYGCAFEQQQRFSFSFASDLTTNVQGDNLMGARGGNAPSVQASAPEQLVVTSSGRLHAFVLAVTSSREAIVAVRLGAWTFEPAELGEAMPWQADLLRPYLIRVRHDCQIVDVARHREANVAAFAQVLGLVDRLQFMVPDAPPATPVWMTRQQDEYGVSQWRYAWQPGAGRGAMTRERLSFEDSALAGGWIDLELGGDTRGSVTLADTSWFERISDHEDVTGTVDGAPVFSFAGTTTFERIDADADGFAGHAVRAQEFVWGRPSSDEVDEANAAARHGDLAGMSVGSVMERYRAIRAAAAPGAWREGQELLRAWILANPDALAEVTAQMRSGIIDEREAAEWALALARSGSDVARGELQRLAADANARENVRVQATSALADLPRPDATTVDTLTRLSARADGTSEHDLVGSTATMSLGTLLGTHPVNPAMENAQMHLQAMIHHPNPVMAAEALWAVGNSGDAGFVPLLETLDNSAEPRVRRGVARATRRMERGDTEQMLAAMLRDDVDPDVVTEVVNSHREQMQRGGAVLTPLEINLYRTKLPSAPEQVRRAMIEALGVASRREPAAADVLIDWFPHETVQDLRVMIGRYISADRLP